MLEEKGNSRAKTRAQRMAPEARRRQLTDCAVRVFARNGLGNAGHAQVADEAGVSTATVFLYLPNRQALIDCVLGEVHDYFVGMVARAVDSEASAPAKLLAVTRAYARANETDPDFVKVFLNWSTVIHDETWPSFVEFQDHIFAALEDVIRQGVERGEVERSVDPVLGAHLVMGAALMITQMKFRGRSDAQIDAFLRALIRGVLTSDPAA